MKDISVESISVESAGSTTTETPVTWLDRPPNSYYVRYFDTHEDLGVVILKSYLIPGLSHMSILTEQGGVKNFHSDQNQGLNPITMTGDNEMSEE